MESGRLFFDPSACQYSNMLFLRNGGAAFREARSMVSIEETSKRRPFFISPDDYLFDEAYYDEQVPDKKRRLTPDQAHMLEKSFETENKLEPERKTQLAKNLGLQPRQVAVWFQNRRARWKTKQIERDYDVLKSSYDALLSNYETLVKENEKLKSEVVSLTEKVEVKMENVSGGNGVILFSNTKLEDGLSSGSGSGGSAVVNDRDGLQQLVDIDSGDEYGGCMGGVDGGGVQSEEDDGGSYFSDVLAAAADDQFQEPWWVWS